MAKGNRNMRRLLDQCASAAVKLKGSIFQLVCRRLLPRLGHKQAIWAVAHKLCHLIWMILHKGLHYQERGPAVSERSKRVRTNRMIRMLRKLGYQVEPPIIQRCALGNFRPCFEHLERLQEPNDPFAFAGLILRAARAARCG